jgi:BMFP domain-containing protein YqiC
MVLIATGEPSAMQTSNRVLDDLARVANGAVSTMVGIKGEIEALVRQQIERLLVDADMVPRDEFDAVKAMAAKARSEQEALEKRMAKLESKLGIKPAAKKAKAKAAAKTAKSKTASKPKPRATKAKAKTAKR